MVDSKRRVKVYFLEDDEKWFDRGTGQIHLYYRYNTVDLDPKTAALYEKENQDDDIVIESKDLISTNAEESPRSETCIVAENESSALKEENKPSQSGLQTAQTSKEHYEDKQDLLPPSNETSFDTICEAEPKTGENDIFDADVNESEGPEKQPSMLLPSSEDGEAKCEPVSYTPTFSETANSTLKITKKQPPALALKSKIIEVNSPTIGCVIGVPHIRVRSEANTSDFLIDLKLRPFIHYSMQDSTLIVWTEATGEDMALSFQEKDGCLEFWCNIRQASMSFYKDVESRELAFDVEESFPLSFRDPLLANPSISNISRVSVIISRLCEITYGRERLIQFIKSDNYFLKLYDLFDSLEDLDAKEHLAILFEITKNLVLLGDPVFYSIVLDDRFFMKTLGILEYDTEIKDLHGKFRTFFEDKVRYIPFLKTVDSTFHQKVIFTYRLQFLRDVALARFLEDPIFNHFSDAIKSLYADIVTAIFDNPSFPLEILTAFNVHSDRQSNFPKQGPGSPNRLLQSSDTENTPTANSSVASTPAGSPLIGPPVPPELRTSSSPSSLPLPHNPTRLNKAVDISFGVDEQTGNDKKETAQPIDTKNSGQEKNTLESEDVLRRRHAAGFLRELAVLSKNCRDFSCSDICLLLHSRGIFKVIAPGVCDKDLKTRQAFSEFLTVIIDYEKSLLRNYCLSGPLLRRLSERLLYETDNGLLQQWVEVLKLLLEVDFMTLANANNTGAGVGGNATKGFGLGVSFDMDIDSFGDMHDDDHHAGDLPSYRNSDRSYVNFISKFYEDCTETILKPLKDTLQNQGIFRAMKLPGLDEKINIMYLPEDFLTRILPILELIVFMIRTCPYKFARHVLTDGAFVNAIKKIAHSAYKHLQLMALKVLKSLIHISDGFYVVEKKLVEPVFQILLLTEGRPNLLNSSALEFFEILSKVNSRHIKDHVMRHSRYWTKMGYASTIFNNFRHRNTAAVASSRRSPDSSPLDGLSDDSLDDKHKMDIDALLNTSSSEDEEESGEKTPVPYSQSSPDKIKTMSQTTTETITAAVAALEESSAISTEKPHFRRLAVNSNSVNRFAASKTSFSNQEATNTASSNESATSGLNVARSSSPLPAYKSNGEDNLLALESPSIDASQRDGSCSLNATAAARSKHEQNIKQPGRVEVDGALAAASRRISEGVSNLRHRMCAANEEEEEDFLDILPGRGLPLQKERSPSPLFSAFNHARRSPKRKADIEDISLLPVENNPKHINTGKPSGYEDSSGSLEDTFLPELLLASSGLSESSKDEIILNSDATPFKSGGAGFLNFGKTKSHKSSSATDCISPKKPDTVSNGSPGGMSFRRIVGLEKATSAIRFLAQKSSFLNSSNSSKADDKKSPNSGLTHANLPSEKRSPQPSFASSDSSEDKGDVECSKNKDGEAAATTCDGSLSVSPKIGLFTGFPTENSLKLLRKKEDAPDDLYSPNLSPSRAKPAVLSVPKSPVSSEAIMRTPDDGGSVQASPKRFKIEARAAGDSC